jgi:NTE family protein
MGVNGSKVRAVRVGVVLGAGGSVGVAYHGAVLAAIEEVTCWDPRRAELVAGTSAGSVTAALLRAGVSAGDLRCTSENLPLSDDGARLAAMGRPHRPRPRIRHALNFRPVADPVGVLQAFSWPFGRTPAALLAALMPAGGIPTDALSQGINQAYAGRWPTDPMWLCSVDLRSGRRVVFGRPGSPPVDVGDAVAASSAIPGYFQPVRIGARRYVDGGVTSMVNLDVVAGFELDLVIVSSPMSGSPTGWPLHPSTVVRRRLGAQLRTEVAALRRAGVPVITIEPDPATVEAMGLNPMDARQRGRVSRAAWIAMLTWLGGNPEGRRLVRALCKPAQGEAGERTTA